MQQQQRMLINRLTAEPWPPKVAGLFPVVSLSPATRAETHHALNLITIYKNTHTCRQSHAPLALPLFPPQTIIGVFTGHWRALNICRSQHHNTTLLLNDNRPSPGHKFMISRSPFIVIVYFKRKTYKWNCSSYSHTHAGIMHMLMNGFKTKKNIYIKVLFFLVSLHITHVVLETEALLVSYQKLIWFNSKLIHLEIWKRFSQN